MATRESETCKWVKHEVDALVNIMVEEVIKGNKTTTTFNTNGWDNIKTKLETQLGRKFTKIQLRNKMNKLRIDYNSFKRLLSQSGFGWNTVTRRVDVDSEEVWERHIKDNPDWKKYKRNGLPQWPELQTIFGGSQATGDDGYGNNEQIPDVNDLYELHMDDHSYPTTPAQEGLNQRDPTVEADGANESTPGLDDISPSDTNTHRLDRTPNSLRKKRKTPDISGACQLFMEVSKAKLANLTAANPSSSQETIDIPKPCSVGACVQKLMKMGLDKQLHKKAVSKLIENPEWREAFWYSVGEFMMDLLDGLQ